MVVRRVFDAFPTGTTYPSWISTFRMRAAEACAYVGGGRWCVRKPQLSAENANTRTDNFRSSAFNTWQREVVRATPPHCLSMLPSI